MKNPFTSRPLAAASPRRHEGQPGSAAARGAGGPGPGPGSDAVEIEHAGLARGRGLQRVHRCLLAASVIVTLAAWQHSRTLVIERTADRFERERAQLSGLLVDRFARYEDLLRGGAATLGSHGRTLSGERWRAFVHELDVATRYPGISSLAIALPVAGGRVGRFTARQRRRRPDFAVRPDRGERAALPIVHIEPEAAMRHALGLDLLHEPSRARAANAARDTGEPRLTAPLSLVRRADRAPGLVLMMPVYHRDPTGLATVPDRRDAFAGVVLAPFALEGLATGALGRDGRHIGMRISDAGTVLHDELGPQDPDVDAHPLHADAFELRMYGRTWRVEVATDLSFRADAGLVTPWAVLVAGIGADIALLGLFAALSRRGGRALACADRAMLELRGRVDALARSSAELEGFAHVVSHDLKTPVRGIGDLVGFLAEDLEPWLASDRTAPEVERHLERLDQQHRRLTDLIDGVLAYSALGREHVGVEELDVRRAIDAVARELGLDDGRLAVTGDRPVFPTQAVRFEQVMRNLLDNARRHHDGDPAALRVTVRVRTAPGGCRLEVADNGPGIPARFHDAVFEAFRRLRPKDEVEGSGVGLSIVKRSVEALGGSVALRSVPGEGCTVELLWPSDEAVPDETASDRAADAPGARPAMALAA